MDHRPDDFDSGEEDHLSMALFGFQLARIALFEVGAMARAYKQDAAEHKADDYSNAARLAGDDAFETLLMREKLPSFWRLVRLGARVIAADTKDKEELAAGKLLDAVGKMIDLKTHSTDARYKKKVNKAIKAILLQASLKDELSELELGVIKEVLSR